MHYFRMPKPIWPPRRLFGKKSRDSELKHYTERDSVFPDPNSLYDISLSTYSSNANDFKPQSIESTINQIVCRNKGDGGKNNVTVDPPWLCVDERLKNAILAKNKEAVLYCLHNGANPNCRLGNNKDTPLHLATAEGVPEIVQLLLKMGAKAYTVDSQGVTPLHNAANKGCADSVQLLIEAGALVNVQDFIKENGTGNETPLHRAIAGGNFKVVSQLLCSGAHVNICEALGRTPLQYAVMMGQFDATELLLKYGADIDARNVEGGTVLHACAIKGHSSILKLLLQQPAAEKIVDLADMKGRTSLHKAAYRGSAQCIHLLLRAGANPGIKTNSGFSATKLILQLPNGTQILKKRLDEFITSNRIDPNEADCRIYLDYSIFLRHPKYLQMGMVKDILSDKKESHADNLLRHPLIESFLGLKWRKIRYLFFINVFIYMIFITLVTLYVFCTVSSDLTAPIESWEFNAKGRNITTETVETNGFASKPETGKALQSFLYVFVMTVIFEEMIYLSMLKHWYFKRIETWMKISTLITSSVIIFSRPPWSLTIHKASAVAILLGWSEVTLLLGRLPTFGVYALMFYTVTKNLVKFISAYFFFLAGFSFSFYLLFNKYHEAFQSPWRSFLRTFAMMLGDPNYEEFMKDGQHNFNITAHMIYFFFLALVSLILMNLLIGLAVYDIQGLQKEGQVKRLRKQAEYIIFLEKAVNLRFVDRILNYTGFNARLKSWLNLEPVFVFRPGGRKLKANLPPNIAGRIVALVKKNLPPVESFSVSETLLKECVESIGLLRTQMEGIERKLINQKTNCHHCV